MSQDIVTTAAVVVDTASVSPTAPFRNPASGGQAGNAQMEALAIVNGNICHLARTQTSDSGWQALSPFGTQAAKEVAAGTAYAASNEPSVYGFFHDGVTLYWTQLQADGVTWSTPGTMSTLGTNLKVAYTPQGQVILYGNTATGDLLLVYPNPTAPGCATTTCGVDNNLAAGDFSLCMTDEITWWLAANVSGTPNTYTGTLSSTTPDDTTAVSAFAGQLAKVALSFYASSQDTLMSLFIDTGGHLHVWAQSSLNTGPVIQPIANSSVTSASGAVDLNGNLHIYSVDGNQGLWVLHQDSEEPWNDDGTPNWASYIALDNEVGGLATDLNPADAPTLFVVDAGDGSLRLHSQDPATQMWNAGPLLQSAPAAYDVSRFRTELNVLNGYSNPLPNQAVSVQVADGGSAVELWIAGQIYQVTSTAAVPLSTDARGKLTFSTLTNAGMSTPTLIVTVDGLPAPISVSPSAPVLTYLSGKGVLNPTNPNGALPAFDSAGATLAGAKNSQNQPLAPTAQNNQALAGTAAQAIQQTALLGLNQTPAGVTGFAMDVSDRQNPTFTSFTTQEELSAHVAAMGGPAAGLGDFWNDLENWAGDVWEGIKNGVAAITKFVVDAVNKVVTLTVQLGNLIANGVTIALGGIEQAAHAVAGIFQVVAADIEDVINWLRALFDFGAIWRTKMAFEQALTGLPPVIKNLVGMASNDINGWFAAKETEINNAIGTLKSQFGTQTISSLPNFQTPGQAPDNTTPIAGSATAADFNNNVHHNWLQDKVSAYAPPTPPVTPGNTLQTPWENFVSAAQTSGSDFVTALKDFAKAVQILATDPSQIGTLGISDFLDGIQGLVDSALNLCDALIQGFLAMVDGGIDVIVTMLGATLDLGPINTLWSWIAKVAGYPDDNRLTMGGLLSLIGAFPCTVVYKLIEGVSNEPFPDGQLPPPPATGGVLTAAAGGGNMFQNMPFGCHLSASILQILYVVPAAIGDWIGNSAPWYFTAATVTLTAAMFVLNNGIPQLTAQEWGLVFSTLSATAITVPLVGLLLSSFQEQLNRLGALIQAASADVMNLLFTVYGVVRFLFDVAVWAETGPPVLVGASSLLLPVPSAFAWLRMSVFRDDEEWAPIFQAASVVMDAIGYVGGGICQLVAVCTDTDTAVAHG